jgi:hypothetical protein
MWSRILSSNSRYKDSMADVDEILVDDQHSVSLPEMRDGSPGKSPLQNLINICPHLEHPWR